MSTELVAIAGVAATAITAIVGFLVQARIAEATRREDRRRSRYHELVSLYQEAGAQVATLESSIEMALVGGTWVTEAQDERHVRRGWEVNQLLSLHGASEEVEEIWDSCMQLQVEWADFDEHALDSPEARDEAAQFRVRATEAARVFHEACHRHLASVWPLPHRDVSGTS